MGTVDPGDGRGPRGGGHVYSSCQTSGSAGLLEWKGATLPIESLLGGWTWWLRRSELAPDLEMRTPAGRSVVLFNRPCKGPIDISKSSPRATLPAKDNVAIGLDQSGPAYCLLNPILICARCLHWRTHAIIRRPSNLLHQPNADDLMIHIPPTNLGRRCE